MSTALELFAQGQLTEAIRLQRQVVAAKPDDANLMLLAELLLFDGQFDEVSRQVERFSPLREGMRAYASE